MFTKFMVLRVRARGDAAERRKLAKLAVPRARGRAYTRGETELSRSTSADPGLGSMNKALLGRERPPFDGAHDRIIASLTL
jgi:hypothetical protein